MIRKIDPAFWYGDQVYLISDPDQALRQIINVVITPDGIQYTVRIEGAEVDVYEIELSRDKTVF